MKTIILSQNKVALVDDKDFEWLNQWKWYYGSRDYAIRKKHIHLGKYRYKTESILMHREIMKVSRGIFIDHINGNGIDNRKQNLRIATQQQNMCNSKTRSDNTSGYRGVWWDEYHKKWAAEIHFNNKKKTIGRYEDIKNAAKAYNDASLKYHGEYGRLNQI
ncbi:MAG: AP2 domain-containing protein [Nanoarchaeota archaeon]